MQLSDFMQHDSVNAYNNDDGTWMVEITLPNLKIAKLVVEECSTEWEAKERTYLYLNERIAKAK